MCTICDLPEYDPRKIIFDYMAKIRDFERIPDLKDILQNLFTLVGKNQTLLKGEDTDAIVQIMSEQCIRSSLVALRVNDTKEMVTNGLCSILLSLMSGQKFNWDVNKYSNLINTYNRLSSAKIN